MRALRFLIPLCLITVLAACTVEPVDPSADIPTQSFQADIFPIISANCSLAGCHGANDEEFPLLNYDDVINYCEVEPGKPHNSELYEVIRLLSGEEAMPPKPNQALTDKQIGAIYVWILQGAKNN